jgi:hypothetical protein
MFDPLAQAIARLLTNPGGKIAPDVVDLTVLPDLLLPMRFAGPRQRFSL